MKGAVRQRFFGFTLIELLVAVTVLALLLLVLASVIGKVSDIWRWGKGRADNHTKARISLDLIQRDLQSAVIGRGLPGFAATNSELEFYCTRLGPMAGGLQSKRPLCVVSYRVVDTGSSLYDRGLQRGLAGLEFGDAAPFATNAGEGFPGPVPAMSNMDYQIVGPGVLRMDYRFLSRDGRTVSRTFNWDPANQGSNSAAVAICLLVIDEDTLRMMNENASYASFLENFDTSVSGISDDELPYPKWLEAIAADSTFSGVLAASKVRQALQIYERTVRLPIPQ